MCVLEGEDEESAPVCDANPQTCSDFVLAAVVDAPPVVVQKRRVAENTHRVKKHDSQAHACMQQYKIGGKHVQSACEPAAVGAGVRIL